MKKETKKTTKNAVKKVKEPDMILNYIDCKSIDDLYNRLTYAKVRAGKAITEDELDTAITYAVDNTAKLLMAATLFTWTACPCVCCEKKPWYKKVWNKITSWFHK